MNTMLRKHYNLSTILFICLALPLSIFAQTQGVSIRATNGVAFGRMTVNSHISATNAASTNTFSGRFQQGSGLSTSTGAAAFGLNTKSGGNYSFVTGIGSETTGAASLIGGLSNNVSSSATASLVGGYNNTAAGLQNFIVGSNNFVDGAYGAAIGRDMTFDAPGSSALGNTIAFGRNIHVLAGTTNSFVFNSSESQFNTTTHSNAFWVNSPGGIFFSGAPITGSGAGLTNVVDAGLSANVALLNRANQTFTGGTNIFAKVSIGGIQLYGNSPVNSLIARSDVNSSDSISATILGGSAAGNPNLVGSPTKPVGADYTPTGWADDTNYVAGSASQAWIGGGGDQINNQQAGSILGGAHNFIKYNASGHSMIGGGSYNVISGGYGAICYGLANTITGPSSYNSFIGSGFDNNIIGSYSVVPGGRENDITGDYSFASGHRVKVTASGVFAISDQTDADFTASTTNEFAARFAGGYRLTAGSVTIPDGNLTAGGAGISTILVSRSSGVLNFGARNAAGSTYYFGATAGATPSAVFYNTGGTLRGTLTDAGDFTVGGSMTAANGVLWQGGAQLTNIYTATATLDFGNVATIGCADLTISVTGAALGDVVDLGVPNASVVANSSYSAWVSSADTVTVRFCALISGDPASGVFRAEVHKWK